MAVLDDPSGFEFEDVFCNLGYENVRQAERAADEGGTSSWRRSSGEPVCTGCAVTKRFALKAKYFYDEENLEAFREEYAAMPIHEKAMENQLLAGGSVVATLLAIISLLMAGGII